MAKSATTKDHSPSRLIDARIKELGDWRGETLARVRNLIKQADPEVVEEWKWRGVPRGGPVFQNSMAAWLRWILGWITPPISPGLPA